MQPQMQLQPVRVRQNFMTNLTNSPPLPSNPMHRSQMSPKTIFKRKHLFANITTIPLILPFMIELDVIVQVAFKQKTFIAKGALEFFYTIVTVEVFDENRVTNETFMAGGAHEREVFLVAN